MAEIHVTAAVRIARAATDVFDYVANFENNPAWQQGMRSARFTSEPPLRVGSTYAQEARFLGKRIESQFEVTALDPGRSITIETRESTFPIQVTRSVVPDDDGGCTVSAEVSGSPSGVFAIAAPLMRRMVARSVRKDYARLKQVLEQSLGDA